MVMINFVFICNSVFWDSDLTMGAEVLDFSPCFVSGYVPLNKKMEA